MRCCSSRNLSKYTARLSCMALTYAAASLLRHLIVFCSFGMPTMLLACASRPRSGLTECEPLQGDRHRHNMMYFNVVVFDNASRVLQECILYESNSKAVLPHE